MCLIAKDFWETFPFKMHWKKRRKLNGSKRITSVLFDERFCRSVMLNGIALKDTMCQILSHWVDERNRKRCRKTERALESERNSVASTWWPRIIIHTCDVKYPILNFVSAKCIHRRRRQQQAYTPCAIHVQMSEWVICTIAHGMIKCHDSNRRLRYVTRLKYLCYQC